MKKALSFLIAIGAMSLMCVGVQAAQYSAGAETAKAGENVSIPVKVAPSTAGTSETVNGYAVELTYDSTVLTPVQKGTDLAGGNCYAESAMTGGVLVADVVDVADSTTDKVVVAWADANPATISAETVLANVEFTVNANASVPSTPIGVKVIQVAKDATTLDTTYTVAEGSVTLGSDILYGDVNDDKRVNAADASLVVQYTLGTVTLDEQAIIRANVDGNVNSDNSPKVNAADASMIIQKYLGSLAQFPVEK